MKRDFSADRGLLRGLCVLMTLAVLGCADRAPNDPRAAWLATNATTIKTLDFAAQDDSDLAALGAAIGDSRVVLLGEPDHTSGAVLAAKSRLVRHLHERMGFDVLVFEAGLFDMSEAWRQIAQGGDAERIARASGAAIWFLPLQGRPLLEYVQKSAKTARGLEIAGMDFHSPSALTGDRLLPELEGFLDRARIARPEGPKFAEDLNRLLRARAGEEIQAGDELPAELGRIRLALQPLMTAGDLAREARFWDRVLLNVESSARALSQPGFDQVRERQMADNLLWLIKERYPDKKIIVWGATFHLLRNGKSIQASGKTARDLARGTVGDEVWKALGEQAYLIGWTGSEGIVGLQGSERNLQPAPPGSLEQLFASTGRDYAFVDLRRPKAGGEWLKGDLISRPLGYTPFQARWPEVLDGVFFIREMEPLTPVKRQG